MSRLGFKSVIFHGEWRLGELDVIPVLGQNIHFPNEFRIRHISPRSDRCSPLSILQTISAFSVRCKLESLLLVEQPSLINLHAFCFHELKTAVAFVGDEEFHLVAMPSERKKFPCFWCYSVPVGLYNACLGMLNLRCLAIVFDLDETLIVANTLKSFEDRIESLRGWLAGETDPLRISGMSAELKRYMDDRMLLKQYAESDCVVDNGKIIKVQLEEVPPLSDDHEKVVRPVIRLQERNVVLTRINPEIRDTSVLVRLRPAWEDLRCYLNAKGRKRFEVYVCTKAERDYALEIWRLLDPEAHLISSKQLLDRVICVKSGSRKSLLNVFQDGMCHPNMAMVVDDRLKVWEDRDQPRVHEVPAFTPYYAPQAEIATADPVLRLARNVACNARTCFFKEFDENILQRISNVLYEDEIGSLPHPLDVSNYLMPEGAGFVPNNSTNVLKCEAISAGVISNKNFPGSSRSLMPSPKPGLLGPPVRHNVFSVDRNYDVKRGLTAQRLGVNRKGQGSGGPPLISRPPNQALPSLMQTHVGLLAEDDISSRAQPNNCPAAKESNVAEPDIHQVLSNLFSDSTPVSTPTQSSEMNVKEANFIRDLQRQTLPSHCQLAENGACKNHLSSNGREIPSEAIKLNSLPYVSIIVLKEIGRRCSSKVEFRSVVSTRKDLQFSVEVLFTGEKIGIGMARTRKDAHQQAAENALHNLADKYKAHMESQCRAVDREFDKLSLGDDNGFLWDVVNPESSELQGEDALPKESVSETRYVETSFPTSNGINQQLEKHASSPRLPIPVKRVKE